MTFQVILRLLPAENTIRSIQRLVETPYLLSAGIGDHECILEYSACKETRAVLGFAPAPFLVVHSE